MKNKRTSEEYNHIKYKSVYVYVYINFHESYIEKKNERKSECFFLKRR